MHESSRTPLQRLLTVIAVTGCSLFMQAGRCEVGWPGVCGSEEVNLDTWQVDCGCARPSGIGGAAVATWNFCFEGTPAAAELANRCGAAAWDLNFRLGLGGTGDLVQCVPLEALAERIGTDNCPATVAGACEDLTAAEEPLVSAAHTPLHGLELSNATYVGEIDEHRSTARLRVRGETVYPEITGTMHISGGDCPGAECDVRVDSVALSAAPFTIGGLSITGFEVGDWGPWTGHKNADDTYDFNPENAELKVSGIIAGNQGALIGKPVGIPGGELHGPLSLLPDGETSLHGYITVEGTFAIGDDEIEVFLLLHFMSGAPRADVQYSFTPCGIVATPGCGLDVFRASGSRTFDGGPVARYDWYDANGVHLGTSSSLSVAPISGGTAFPLTVVVTDSNGRTSSITVEDPRPAPPAAQAWLWAERPSFTSLYTPSASYQHNSANLSNTVTRTSTGKYRVRFPAVARGGAGAVHATAYGASNRFCNVSAFRRQHDDVLVDVACFTPSGVASDSYFTASFARDDEAATTGARASVYASVPLADEHTPGVKDSFNDTGARNRVVRNSIGNYTVELPGMGSADASVQVTAVGDANRCNVLMWGVSSGSARVSVTCSSAAGSPRDAAFTLSYAANAIPGARAKVKGAYAWAGGTAAGTSTPSLGYQHNMLAGGNLTQSRTGVGQYSVIVPNALGVRSDSLQITTYGPNTASCMVTGWGRETSQTRVGVRCFGTAGEARDSRFNVTYSLSSP